MRVQNRWFALILCTIILLISSMLIIKLNRWNCRQPIAQLINPDKPMVAITFDDGPNPKFTPQVLDVLYENNALGTFFICGENIGGNEDLLKEMVKFGHEIENHTDSHKNLALLTREQIIYEIVLPQERLEEVLPEYKFKYIRPPFGEYSEDVEDVAGLPLVLWDVDSDDYIQRDVDVICDNVRNKVKDGSVVVFHDDNKSTVEALKIIIPELQEEGFQFVTLEQLDEYR